MKVRVWDLPTRMFHWLLALCVAGLIVTGEIAGTAMVWHFRLGYATLTLVLFRFAWGFCGGYWSRFSVFVKGPAQVLAYLKGKGSSGSLGHNPLGAVSVLALLGFLILQSSTGLISDDEILVSGPLAAKVPGAWVARATTFHTTVGKFGLIALVCLHVGAIIWYRFKRKTDLVTPMWSGDKEVSESVNASTDNNRSRLTALIITTICGVAVWALLAWAATAP
jgi:cytochrome b